MTLKFAIAGMRHGHINDLIARVRERPDTKLVAVCEQDAATRAKLDPAALGAPVIDSRQRLWSDIECDVVGIGDYYGARGAIAIEASEHGKHVISDKPLCTSLAELDRIEKLARERRLRVGMQLDMRDRGSFRALRRHILEGAIGEVQAVSINGQHPLLYGTRAGWYFEPGKHGGTINDIGIHAIDGVQWFTGQKVAQINCARAWNIHLKDKPWFKDGGQFMLTLANGAGVLGDMSYLAPDTFGYGLPDYWRVMAWGTKGLITAGINLPHVTLWQNGAKVERQIAPEANNSGGYLEAFLADIRDKPLAGESDTASICASSRITLMIQEAADTGRANVGIP